ncbi:MAG: flagellar biosynthesis anti-sigma factor FlgM [Moorellales bacterium]
MKIEGQGPAGPGRVYPVEEGGRPEARGQVTKPEADRVQVSAEARLRQELFSRLKALPEIRTELVEALIRRRASGSYGVDPEALAAAIVEELGIQRR